MVLTISGWPDGAQIPAKFTQAGEQVSPKLDWTNVPAGTLSFVVNMLDPDVSIQKGTETQPHWIVWNIPGTAAGLPEGLKAGADLPDGSHQISASGPQYRGPGAAANGPLHHYTFEVYALDVAKLDVRVNPRSRRGVGDAAAVMKAMQGIVGRRCMSVCSNGHSSTAMRAPQRARSMNYDARSSLEWTRRLGVGSVGAIGHRGSSSTWTKFRIARGENMLPWGVAAAHAHGPPG
jgi:Raf kinase inhibitor-like YbhB/YbcL family protein